MLSHTKEEKALLEKGYQYIVGIDEAGRGALAGPVVAAAVVMPISHIHPRGVKDSKLLTPKRRGELYEEIMKNCHGYSVGVVGPHTIDQINIYQAAKLAMKKAVESIEDIDPDYLLIDAMKVETNIPQKAIVRGDATCYSISCASIIAKVTRDRIMKELHEKFPYYSFDQHKGYGTALHLERLKKHGPCRLHRYTYKPVADTNSKLQNPNIKQ